MTTRSLLPMMVRFEVASEEEASDSRRRELDVLGPRQRAAASRAAVRPLQDVGAWCRGRPGAVPVREWR